MTDVRGYIGKYYKIVGFIVATIIIFFDFLMCETSFLMGDAYGYDLLAEWFVKQGVDALIVQPPVGSTEAYLLSLRAYAWPFIIACCKMLSGGTQIGYHLFYAMFISLGLAYALPEFFELLFKIKVKWYLRLIPTLLTIVFWNGLIKYPLSDIPSVITVVLGLVLLLKLSDEQRMSVNILMAFLCGALLCVSYYIRSGCKPIVVIALLGIMIYKLKKQIWKKLILCLAFCCGALLVMIPQILINMNCSGVMSYEVPIFINTSITNQSYYNGFYWLRYETNISGIHPDIAMISYNDTIHNILAVENISIEDISFGIILKLMMKYPLEFLGMYATKFANFLDPRYGNDIYITDVSSSQYGVMIINFLIWFCAVWGIVVQMNEKVIEKGNKQIDSVVIFFRKYLLYVVAFMIPAFVHLAGTHVEARYFYPVYAFVYMYLASLCPWKKMILEWKKKWFSIMVICIAIFGCLNAIWNFTFQNFNYSQLLLDTKYEMIEGTREDVLNWDTGTQNINYDIWSLEMNNGTYLTMTGYIWAVDKQADESRLRIVLSGVDKTYIFDTCLADNMYIEEPYKNSKYILQEELAGLENGNYEIGFILTNAEDVSVVFTERYVYVEK